MKLHRLELEGFGPFRARQVVDFDAFERDGIFLITGRTGAGKSSILDGVCFALYGNVPRYEGGEKRLRSDHSAPDEPTEVVLEFTTGDARWRVTRSPEYERPKQRGDGMRKVGADAHLDEWVGGEWVGRASGPRNVAEHLDGILQVTMAQFLQVILLAQNRFARFLLADNRERQALLRTLFGTRRFEDYEKAFEDRRKDAERELERGGAELTLLLGEAEKIAAEQGFSDETAGATESHDDVSEDAAPSVSGVASRIEAINRALQRGRYRVEASALAREQADGLYRSATEFLAERVALATAFQQRDRARAAMAEIESAQPDIDAIRAVWERALRAEAVRGAIDTAARAEQSLAVAVLAERSAHGVWVGLASDAGEITPVALSARIDELSGDIALWRQAEADERDLVSRETRMADDAQRVDVLEREVVEIATRRAAFPAERERLDTAISELEPLAAALTSAQQRAREASVRVAESARAEALESALVAAGAAHLAAAAAHADASAAWAAILQRRIDGYAGELAAALEPGRPCAVCGAVEHPSPATGDVEPVTPDDVAAAERHMAHTSTAERAAADATRSARMSHAEAAARAGGLAVDAARIALHEAEATVAQSTEAATARDALVADRARATVADEVDARDHAARTEELAQLRGTLEAARQSTREFRERLAEARGEFASISERRLHAERMRTAARDLVEAIREREGKTAQAEQAAAGLADQVAESGFEDPATAVAALMTPQEREASDTRIRRHDTAREAERGRLRELELRLAGIDEGAVDVAAAEAAAEQSRAHWSAAVAAARDAETAATRLDDYASRAIIAHEGVAVIAAAHEAIASIAHAVAGRNTYRMTLETFVLAAELEEIVAAANSRLEEMSSGRFALRHSDTKAARGAASGLGLEVLDAHTGRARPTASLSGGETFLASLALALGLAEVVTARAGGVRLDTLFVDEGFGALDADTLDLAMRTLDELRQGGRTVGVISHVEAMKEQLPAQVQVEAMPHGASIIRQDLSD